MSDTTIRRPVRWVSAHATDVGLVREANEDAVFCSPEQQLWAVADGMGGYEAGSHASDMVVKSLDPVTRKGSLNDIVNSVEDSLIDVNHRILEYADIMLDGRTLGSTVVTLIIQERTGICMWVGDSRLYRHRGGELVQLSRDHSRVEELLMQGHISQEEAGNHPDSNVITRAVGACAELYVDINVFTAQLGDTFLLCSDGLYNMVSNEAIARTIENFDVEEAVESLVNLALDNGASDNVSVVLVRGERDFSASDSRQVGSLGVSGCSA